MGSTPHPDLLDRLARASRQSVTGTSVSWDSFRQGSPLAYRDELIRIRAVLRELGQALDEVLI